MKWSRSIVRRMTAAAPWLTLTLLVVTSQLLPNRASFSADAQAQKLKVAQAMQSVPYFINRHWVGEDALDKVPREAQELLRPNAILSRSYTSPGRPLVHVLVVHCHDARDMNGHYPPVCYPSSGWVVRDNPGGVDHTIQVRGLPLTVREYIFTRPRDRAREDAIRILNAFVLPDGKVTPLIEDISRQSERVAVSVQGVAQLQIITHAAVPLTDTLQAAEELLGGMAGLLDALNVNKEKWYETHASTI